MMRGRNSLLLVALLTTTVFAKLYAQDTHSLEQWNEFSQEWHTGETGDHGGEFREVVKRDGVYGSELPV
jgi:hypothetical protein